MAVYNQVLNYGFRDSLSSGDPNKVIKGAYFDGEFSAIHTASLDAASLSGNNTFTGVQSWNGNTNSHTLAGKLAIGTPNTGTTLTVSSLENVNGVIFQGPNTGNGFNVAWKDTTNNVLRGFIGIGASTITGAAVTDFGIAPGTSGRLIIGMAGGSAIGATVSTTGSGLQIQAKGQVSGTFVDMSPDTSSWVGVMSGPWVVGNNVNITLKWERQGTQVTIWCDTGQLQAATLSAGITISLLPAAITPSSTRQLVCAVISNGVTTMGGAAVTSTNQIILSQGANFNNFTGGNCGLGAGFSISYSL